MGSFILVAGLISYGIVTFFIGYAWGSKPKKTPTPGVEPKPGHMHNINDWAVGDRLNANRHPFEFTFKAYRDKDKIIAEELKVIDRQYNYISCCNEERYGPSGKLVMLNVWEIKENISLTERQYKKEQEELKNYVTAFEEVVNGREER